MLSVNFEIVIVAVLLMLLLLLSLLSSCGGYATAVHSHCYAELVHAAPKHV